MCEKIYIDMKNPKAKRTSNLISLMCEDKRAILFHCFSVTFILSTNTVNKLTSVSKVLSPGL